MEENNALIVEVLVDGISVKKSEQYLEEFNQALDKTADKSEFFQKNLEKVKEQFKDFQGYSKSKEWIADPINKQSYENLKNILKDLSELKRQSELTFTEIPQGLKTQFQVSAKGDYLSYYTESVKENGDKLRQYYTDIKVENGKLVGALGKAVVTQQADKKGNILQDILKGKAVKKLKDFWGSMKRIFRYRALRAIIQGITNTLRNGFSTISQQSDEVRASTDKLKGAWTAVSVSLASTLVPVVESLSSMLEPLANYMINYANSMSLANAEAQGQAQYFKLDKDAIDEYAKSLQNANKQLTALDKFATLSGTKNKSIGYYTGITDEEKENTQKALEETKKSSFGLGEVIFNIIASIKDLIQWFSNLGTKGQQSVLFVAEALLSLISPVFALLSGVKAIATLFSGEASASAKGFAVALLGVFAMIVGIKTLLGDYGSVGLAIGTILGVGGALSVVTGGLVGRFGSTNMGSVAQTVPSANYNIPVQSGTTGNGSVPNYIVVNMDIDGQKFASATAQPMAQALNNRNF